MLLITSVKLQPTEFLMLCYSDNNSRLDKEQALGRSSFCPFFYFPRKSISETEMRRGEHGDHPHDPTRMTTIAAHKTYNKPKEVAISHRRTWSTVKAGYKGWLNPSLRTVIRREPL